MENYIKEGTAKTPTIYFDFARGTLEIKGRSIPENPIEFYEPVIQALNKYSQAIKATTDVSIKLEYLNRSSSKCILNIFKKLESIQSEGGAVRISWAYQQDDEDMLEAGEDYMSIIKVPFKMVQVGE